MTGALVREVIAQRIIELTAIGEREPRRLCQTVLAELGIERRHEVGKQLRRLTNLEVPLSIETAPQQLQQKFARPVAPTR